MWLKRSPRSSRLRLIVPFALLLVLLVSIVLALVRSALASLDEQRALRHGMVAERIFDELEREIGSVLQHEAERTSQAYDAPQTDPGRWSPFVIGYYRRDPQLVLLAEPRLPAERSALLHAVLSETALELAGSRARLLDQGGRPRRAPSSVRPDLDEPRLASTSSPDLLRLLNRSGELRERRMHEFEASFAIARRGSLVIAERTAPELGRAEGLLIDVSRLLDTLALRLLGAPEQRRVQLALSPLSAVAGGYHYQHRLAPPLDAYEVALALPRLDDADASSALHGFAALFALASVLGLLAIYRTLAVQVAFAERRNNFVSAVTHELRTPLTTIRMYGEMLRDGMVTDPETRQEYYATITAEGERLTRLINNVLEHGRLRRGQRRPALQRADPQQLVREAVELMRPHLEREGFTLTLAPAAAMGCWLVDGDALKQIVFNVLDNACKYGRGSSSARIEVSCAATRHGQLELRVRDYGPGVSTAQLPHLFEPFYRGESELTREHQGTGLGLALVRDLAQLMHGSTSAHNREPGFELCVILPLRAAAD